MINKRTGYRELAELLRDRITSGQLRPGAHLPSENALMQEHGIARETARRAIRELSTEGYVEIRHGYPTRVRLMIERYEVRVQRGSRVVVRPATTAERADLGIGPGALVVEIRHGAKVAVYASDQHEFTFA